MVCACAPEIAIRASDADLAEAVSSTIRADESPQQRQRRSDSRAGVHKARITPHWSADNRRFWYRNDLVDGKSEYVLVDAANGVRQKAFDHDRLAKALVGAGTSDVQAQRLALTDLEFDTTQNTLSFRAAGSDWLCQLQTYELTRLETRQRSRDEGRPALPVEDAPRASTRTGPETELVFVNQSAGEVELFWLDSSGQRRSYGKLAAGEERRQHTYAGHVWLVADRDGKTLALFQADEQPDEAIINGQPPPRARNRRSPRIRRDTSPDGNWRAFVRDNNVFVQAVTGQAEIQLSKDGEQGNSYEQLQWAPDSQTLIAWRVEPGEEKEVYLIESSPRGGGRAKLHTRPYMLPGDKYPIYELNLFDADERKQIKPEVERIDFGRPRLRFTPDGGRFTYEKTDRGHQRFRVIEIDSHSGESRNIIDETTDTFIWTAHTEGLGVRMVTWLDETDALIYVSERDGWRHLYLVDAEAGQIRNQITKGDYVVRGVDRIDEQKRQIWFRASGKFADQDPYLVHYFRVNFDGSELVALTQGNGNHSVQFSPDRQYLIDTYSRVDLPPIHELRRTSDGQLMCELERADISTLQEGGWLPPEVFSAKGRDGATDIWGIICRPRDFDPQRKYPVIEDIYAGPQGSYVPKTFSPARRYAALTDLGFVVVKIDGMGTANRSKAFHDVCWKNLKDAGFPDRILWHKAVAHEVSLV